MPVSTFKQSLGALAGVSLIAIGIATFSGQASAQTVQDGNFSGVTTAGELTATTITNNTTGLSGLAPSWSYIAGINGGNACAIVGTSDGSCSPLYTTLPSLLPVATGNAGTPYIAFQDEVGSNAEIYQYIGSLAASTSYTLTYYLAASGNEANSSVVMTADISSGNAGGTAIVSGATGSATLSFTDNTVTAWTKETLNFTTTSATTNDFLSFVSTTSASGPPVAFLDSISLANNSVPEPATLAVLGVGLAAMVGARRRRRQTLRAA